MVTPSAEAVMRQGSRSFAAAARLFDPPTRELVWQLYAWCRHCDDAIDGQIYGHGGPTEVADPRRVLERLEADTEAALAQMPCAHPALTGLARVVAATDLPGAAVRQHLRGFAMDVEAREYESLDDLLDYCYHVAGVVGVMMAWIMGARERGALVRASDLGIAFQLTNIARDAVDDARAGRVYLPHAWLRAAGLTPARVASAPSGASLSPVVGALLEQADRYYASAWHGLPALRFRCAWSVAAARNIYADIGTIVRRRGARAWDERAVVGKGRKAARVTQACVEAAWAVTAGRWQQPPLREGLFAAPIPVMAPAPAWRVPND